MPQPITWRNLGTVSGAGALSAMNQANRSMGEGVKNIAGAFSGYGERKIQEETDLAIGALRAAAPEDRQELLKSFSSSGITMHGDQIGKAASDIDKEDRAKNAFQMQGDKFAFDKENTIADNLRADAAEERQLAASNMSINYKQAQTDKINQELESKKQQDAMLSSAFSGASKPNDSSGNIAAGRQLQNEVATFAQNNPTATDETISAFTRQRSNQLGLGGTTKASRKENFYNDSKIQFEEGVRGGNVTVDNVSSVLRDVASSGRKPLSEVTNQMMPQLLQLFESEYGDGVMADKVNGSMQSFREQIAAVETDEDAIKIAKDARAAYKNLIDSPNKAMSGLTLSKANRDQLQRFTGGLLGQSAAMEALINTEKAAIDTIEDTKVRADKEVELGKKIKKDNDNTYTVNKVIKAIGGNPSDIREDVNNLVTLADKMASESKDVHFDRALFLRGIIRNGHWNEDGVLNLGRLQGSEKNTLLQEAYDDMVKFQQANDNAYAAKVLPEATEEEVARVASEAKAKVTAKEKVEKKEADRVRAIAEKANVSTEELSNAFKSGKNVSREEAVSIAKRNTTAKRWLRDMVAPLKTGASATGQAIALGGNAGDRLLQEVVGRTEGGLDSLKDLSDSFENKEFSASINENERKRTEKANAARNQFLKALGVIK